MTRGSTLKQRTAAQQKLQKLVGQAQELEAQYLEAKNDKPNAHRLADISEIQRVIALISKNLDSKGIAIDHATKASVATIDLTIHLNLYTNSVNQLKGAILSLQQKITNQYSGLTGFFSSKENSALYRLATEIVNPAEMGEDQDAINTATKTCIDAYNLLLETSPKPAAASQVEAAAATSSDDVSESDSPSSLASSTL